MSFEVVGRTILILTPEPPGHRSLSYDIMAVKNDNLSLQKGRVDAECHLYLPKRSAASSLSAC